MHEPRLLTGADVSVAEEVTDRAAARASFRPGRGHRTHAGRAVLDVGGKTGEIDGCQRADLPIQRKPRRPDDAVCERQVAGCSEPNHAVLQLTLVEKNTAAVNLKRSRLIEFDHSWPGAASHAGQAGDATRRQINRLDCGRRQHHGPKRYHPRGARES